MKVAYIVGKISGLPPEEAKDNFEQKKKYLEAQGYDVVITQFEAYDNVMEEFGAIKPAPGSTEEWQAAMSASIFHIVTLGFMPAGFEVHALPNYKDSKGARMELDICLALGIKTVLPPYTVRKKEVEKPRNVHETAL